MDDQNLIPSFQVDHNRLTPGVYISRVDKVGSAYVTTFDVRFLKPNTIFMSPASMHTIEHIGATVLRNSAQWKDKLIYWGGMGCLTGFYMVMKGKMPVEEASSAVVGVLKAIIAWKGPVPGGNKINCGNYRMHNLLEAKRDCKAYLDAKWCHSYPMAARRKVKGVGEFHDS